MEWTRFLTSEWRRWSVLSVIRTAVLEAMYAFINFYKLYNVYCSYMDAYFFLLCNTLGQNLKKYIARRQITYFSTLQAHKNISVYRQCLSKENAVLFKHQLFIYPFFEKSGDLSPPGGASIWMEAGWSYEVSLRDDPMALQSFSDKLFLNAYRWLNIFKTLWFKIIITNYNRDMKFG